LKRAQAIDLMSIDVEGLEESILNSNNWDKFKPKVIIIELLTSGSMGLVSHAARLFLEQRGYVFKACSIRNYIFELKH
jgi:hypothetical protein